MPDENNVRVMKTLLTSYRPVIENDIKAYGTLQRTTQPPEKAVVYGQIVEEVRKIDAQLKANLLSLERGELDRRAAESLMKEAAALAEKGGESGKSQLNSTYRQLAEGMRRILEGKKI